VSCLYRKNVDRKILGFWKATLGRAFGSNFEHGSLMRITKGVFTKDSLSGILVSPFGNYYIHATIKDGMLSGILNDGKHNIAGYVKGSKGLPALPLKNYPAIINKAIALTRDKLYDPALPKSREWAEFTKDMTGVSRWTKDDAAFVMAFFYYSHQLLPFTHYSLYHPLDAAESSGLVSGKNVMLEPKTAKTLYMQISSFSGSAGEMDTAFVNIITMSPDTLIVDLRDNPGGTVAAGMAFIRHLVPDTVYGGIFLTQKYFAAHTGPPTPDQYKTFPIFSEANYDLIIKGIAEYPGMCLMAYPQAPVYKGKVYVLINGNTASTCEPIVYLLKQHRLATLVGARTAGVMLNGEHYDAGAGFILTLPIATYYTSDGYKIDKQGVAPDVAVKPGDALTFILQHTLP